jgi:hypothetical protein
MTDPGRIPWQSIAVEAAAIVVSTLLAFAIDAWWTEKRKVKSSMSRWRRELDNIADISFELRAESVRVRRAMQVHGGPFWRWRGSLDEFEVLPRADGRALASLRQDDEFMGTARSHQYALAVYLASLRGLAETLDATVGSLDEIIALR